MNLRRHLVSKMQNKARPDKETRDPLSESIESDPIDFFCQNCIAWIHRVQW